MTSLVHHFNPANLKQAFRELDGILLRADVPKVDGLISTTELGTPQGSPVSPALPNIYLHFLLDEWFHKHHTSNGRMIRYADDAVSVFKGAKTAKKFRTALEQRLADGKLNLDKSAIVPFARRNPKGASAFLGFELHWGRDTAKRRILKPKTQPKRLARSMKSFTAWIKASRNRMKLDKLWGIARAKLAGHFNDYGVCSSSAKLNHFFFHCVGALFKWLNRRSELRDVSSERSSTKHKPKSWMREIRKSGSVTSSGWQHPVFT